MTPQIRPITRDDNIAVAAVIKAVLQEFGCVGDGFASSDPELDNLFQAYQDNGGRFWVIEDTNSGKILGSGGYSQLKGTSNTDATCEMQKLYFLPELRGSGFGRKLVDLILKHATDDGFKTMYIETVPQMTSAVSFYTKLGFVQHPTSLGCTGHHGCSIYMTKPLTPVTVVSE